MFLMFLVVYTVYLPPLHRSNSSALTLQAPGMDIYQIFLNRYACPKIYDSQCLIVRRRVYCEKVQSLLSTKSSELWDQWEPVFKSICNAVWELHQSYTYKGVQLQIKPILFPYGAILCTSSQSTLHRWQNGTYMLQGGQS